MFGLGLSRKHHDLLSQLRQFSVGRRDDGPDALEMTLTISHIRGGIAYMQLETGRILYHSEYGARRFRRIGTGNAVGGNTRSVLRADGVEARWG